MSIEFSSEIAFGWKVSREEYNTMNELSNFNYEDNFICVDSWSYSSDYIYGITLCHINEGSCIELNLPALSAKIPSDFLSESIAALREMGKDEWFDDPTNPKNHPRLYIIGKVS